MQDPFLIPGASYDRLLTEYDKHGSLVVGVDFDGTLHDYHKEGHTYPKLFKLLDDLSSIGCTIIVWTAYPDLNYVRKFMDENDLPCDGINSDGIGLPWTSRKPFYSVTLDDRCGLLQTYNELDQLAYTIKNRGK